MLYIGLLSGTSIDSIDAGLWSFSKDRTAELVYSINHPIESSLRDSLLNLSHQGQCSLIELGSLDHRLGCLFAQACQTLIEKSGISKSKIQAIGSHGQTIWHEPHSERPFTLQIGDPNIIAQTTGLMTIADFRRADMALGGQGAPLVPAFHHWLFHSSKVDRILVNIGGIANISILKKEQNQAVLGYDTGPGNCLLDSWTLQHWNKPFDQDGQLAMQGTSHASLLEGLLKAPFFAKSFPKSTGRETFNLTWLEPYLEGFHGSPADVLATLVDLTTKPISQAIQHHVDSAEVYVCGGGTHNPALMQSLQKHLGPHFNIMSIETLGMSPDWIESACFAWLAKQRYENQAIPLRKITGSVKNTLLGGIYSPASSEDLELNKLVS